jgi:ribonucleotide reductase beta subunit family protein with ferritin-like domain
MPTANIKTNKGGYIDEYPEFSKIADNQAKIFWPWNEITVSKDKQDLLVGTSESEAHGIISTLKLFTIYELFVGKEQWGSRIAKAYPHVGPERMAAVFAHVELNSHAPFYNEINKVLGLGTMEFYNSYLNDPVLKARVDFLDSLVASDDDELSTACFSLTEGGILYTSFAYLKHFQSNGKNKIANIVRGINMSARDENLHAIGGAGLVNQALKEQERSTYEMLQFQQAVEAAAESGFKHECLIVDKLFEKGPIEGINAQQLKEFAKSRFNLGLNNLNLKSIFEVEDDTVAGWFYKGINNYQMNDFFQGVGREYQRDWNPKRFVWKKG